MDPSLANGALRPPAPKPPVQQQFRPRNEEKRWLQVNPLVCLKSTTSGNLSGDDESGADDEEITLESVQKLYEELFEDWTKRNKLNSSLMKENVELKAVVAKLEVILSKKDLELGHWYFDSGSSRHMTGSREYLTDYVEQKCGRVTYGGGAKGKIVGKGTLSVEGLPKLHNVLHVVGLNSNLISISQLCDDNLHVKFDKHTCEVFDETNMCIMTGTRSSDNYYQIGEGLSCKHAEVSELDLWHQKLGHASFKTLKNLNLKKKTAEDDVDEFLKIPISLENADVAPDVATSDTTPDTEVTEAADENARIFTSIISSVLKGEINSHKKGELTGVQLRN
ncbi:uncharacterized protein LOC142506014 [Primulina tabacum]|uniref:uncharacterized protein LOC142506014 n=1 Tax=Primulina tabacum TaxID=48773 RepID=UPI003F59B90D